MGGAFLGLEPEKARTVGVRGDAVVGLEPEKARTMGGMPNGGRSAWLRPPFGDGCPAVSYSPTRSPGQYHRR